MKQILYFQVIFVWHLFPGSGSASGSVKNGAKIRIRNTNDAYPHHWYKNPTTGYRPTIFLTSSETLVLLLLRIVLFSFLDVLTNLLFEIQLRFRYYFRTRLFFLAFLNSVVVQFCCYSHCLIFSQCCGFKILLTRTRIHDLPKKNVQKHYKNFEKGAKVLNFVFFLCNNHFVRFAWSKQ